MSDSEQSLELRSYNWLLKRTDCSKVSGKGGGVNRGELVEANYRYDLEMSGLEL
jgi:hypothetical protein